MRPSRNVTDEVSIKLQPRQSIILSPASCNQPSLEPSTAIRQTLKQSRYTTCQTAAAGGGLPARLKKVFLLCGASLFPKQHNMAGMMQSSIAHFAHPSYYV